MSSEQMEASPEPSTLEPEVETEEQRERAEATGGDDQTGHLGAVLQGAIGLGGLWASYGLMVGQAALRTSAKTLTSSAEMLGQISDLVEAQTQKKRAELGEA